MINAERIDTDTADRTLAAGTDSGVSALGIDADVTEPTGTAAFDATGDKSAMPSWDELVREHGDRV